MKELVISINNEKDLKKFYKKIWQYKLFKNTIFKLNGNTYEIENIITALNIKNRRKRIEYIYDDACNYIDNYFKDKNTCGFINNQCFTQRGTSNCNGCCRICKYQSNKGCTTANLCCKLFFCSEVRKRYKVIEYKDLNILRVLTWQQRVLIKSNYFSSREEILTDLYIGSILVGSIRNSYKIIKTLFFSKN